MDIVTVCQCAYQSDDKLHTSAVKQTRSCRWKTLTVPNRNGKACKTTTVKRTTDTIATTDTFATTNTSDSTG